jgi:hypothetical protein
MTPDHLTTPAAKPSRPGWLVPVLVAAAVLVLALGGVATWALLRTPASAAPVAAPAPATFGIAGKLTLHGADRNLGQGVCAGNGGYGDLDRGTTVVVTDPNGTVVGVGKLDFGRRDADGVFCEFPFHVDNVPAGLGFYGIEVSHRGAVKFAEADLARPVALTLG